VIKRVVVVSLLTLVVRSSLVLAAPKLVPDDLPGPQAEVPARLVKVEVPAVPAFDLPATEPGIHSPRALRVRGKPSLGTEVKVKGYVTWVYDCAAALAVGNPKATRAQILVSIDNNPALCEYPKFYLGDAKDTSRDRSIWVVDVPRAPNKLERQRLSKAQLAAMPAVPRIAVGDHVVVTGTWAVKSPRAEVHTNGLLVYKAVERATPTPALPAAAPGDAAAEPAIAVVTKIPLRKPVSETVRNTSVGKLNECNKAIAARQYDAGIAACEAATQAWDGNHLAWYAAASAHMAKGAWPQATASVEHAVALRPDQGMYQLYHGIALYEAERQRVREAQAAKDPKKPDEVAVDPSALQLDAARDALLRATKLAPELWRAHYYLGRVYRDRDDARREAEQFSQTITTHPAYRFGYIALIELYRRWDYLDQALAVGLLGTAHVPAAEAADLWFEVGMVHDARRADDQAIEAFSKAIASKPDDTSSKFQRGQIYVRKGDHANARRDLEEVVKSTDPRMASAKQLATQLLARIAAPKR
jgi:tetratricopeptide (TPR) repeat protein